MVHTCIHCRNTINGHCNVHLTCPNCGKPFDKPVTVIGKVSKRPALTVKRASCMYVYDYLSGMTYYGKEVFIDKKNFMYLIGKVDLLQLTEEFFKQSNLGW